MKRFLLSLTAALLLGSFTVPASADPLTDFNTFLTKAQTIATADLQAADADAKAHNDQAASTCYEGVIAYNTANPLQVSNALVPVGVVSGFQVGRDAVKFAESSQNTSLVPTEINKACGWLALDVQADAAKVAAKGFSPFGVKLW